VWVGNIVGKFPMRQFPGGAQFRHKIMATVMKAANKMYTGETNWPTPPAKMLAGGSVKIPALRGLTVEAATTLLLGLGFEVAVGPTVESDLADGLVVQSSPAEGSQAAQGMTITLTPSLQIATFIMPDFLTTLFTQAAAESALSSLGATNPRVRCEEAADPIDPLIGSVFAQYPSAGTELNANSYVRITILQATCN
jgi:beta-lactam-binding protein with PASTA domain